MLKATLIDNIPKMRNYELVGLAKNRFLPLEMQMAIAKTHYRAAIKHLIQNEGLHTSVRDWIWSDECNKGYSFKCELISAGHYMQEPEKYFELYENFQSAWSRTPWRCSDTFLIFGGTHWRGGEATPVGLLHRIYDDIKTTSKQFDGHWAYTDQFKFRRLANHPNCDLKLAIKLSTCGIKEVETSAFKKIVELS
jgi:hypothetical protein